MDERVVAALATLPAAIILGAFGVQMRASRWLNLINGIDLSKVRDREGLGVFAGTLLLAIAAVLVLMAAAIAILPAAYQDGVSIVCTIAMIGIALRIAIGVRAFQRR